MGFARSVVKAITKPINWVVDYVIIPTVKSIAEIGERIFEAMITPRKSLIY